MQPGGGKLPGWIHDPAGSTYAWNLGDGSTSSETSPIHTYTEPGTYSVSLLIETPDGCIDYLNVSNLVTVHPYPVAGFSASADTVSLVNANVSFENTSSGASWYAWDFGDGSPVEHGSSAAHNYADTGTYQIQLIVMNPAGCLDTIFGTIRVEQDFAIYIPNAFTPNKDGVNDGFLPLGVGWTDFEMWIMDRWGWSSSIPPVRKHPGTVLTKTTNSLASRMYMNTSSV